ncbi:toxin-antitoxin system HicB family antitoxin [Nocardioides sp. CF8]
MGEGLHRDLVAHAAEDGLSPNQYVLKKLASA